tara:strand:- start:843 stop:2126 length:1284 start_codon:yes stop_codon:yes gene_type:complete
MRHIFIAAIIRHGSSLLARLFDGHPDIASYPSEKQFFTDQSTFYFPDGLTGSPTYVPSLEEYTKSSNLKNFFNVPDKKEETSIVWEKEKADDIGVRKNYLEKAYYQNLKTNFDYKQFVGFLEKKHHNIRSIHDAYNTYHEAYFNAWDNGKYLGSKKFVAFHASGGLYLKNFQKYFEEFKNSSIIIPTRNVHTYIASEKIRIARLFFGSRRFYKPFPPNFLVKKFSNYDLKALIRTWKISITRTVILKEKFKNYNLIVYRYENLAKDTEATMKNICHKLDLKFDKNLLTPTIANQPWLGNSHEGAKKGINFSDYYENILSKDEINFINKETSKQMEQINKFNETPFLIDEIEKKYLYDYNLQKKYSQNEETWALYSALAFRGFRSSRVRKNNILNVVAYFFSKFIYLCNLPRLIKLKLFPNKGKQNYT